MIRKSARCNVCRAFSVNIVRGQCNICQAFVLHAVRTFQKSLYCGADAVHSIFSCLGPCLTLVSHNKSIVRAAITLDSILPRARHAAGS